MDIVPDGTFLGADVERGYPLGQPVESWWRIVDLPGVLNSDTRLADLKQNHYENGVLIWKRDRRIDLNALEAWAASEVGRPLAVGETIVITKNNDINQRIINNIIVKV